MHRLLTRFINYYREHGLTQTVRRIIEQPSRISKGYMLLIYAELKELDDAVLDLPRNIIIECKKSYAETLEAQMEKLIDHSRKTNVTNRIKERFEDGALLWIMKLNSDIAGYGWTTRKTMAAAFPLPITPHDAILFDFEIFGEYRGRGFYGLLVNYIFGQLKLMGTTRAFGLLSGWNSSVIRAIERTHFHKFREVRNFHVFRRNIIIWS